MFPTDRTLKILGGLALPHPGSDARLVNPNTLSSPDCNFLESCETRLQGFSLNTGVFTIQCIMQFGHQHPLSVGAIQSFEVGLVIRQDGTLHKSPSVMEVTFRKKYLICDFPGSENFSNNNFSSLFKQTTFIQGVKIQEEASPMILQATTFISLQSWTKLVGTPQLSCSRHTVILSAQHWKGEWGFHVNLRTDIQEYYDKASQQFCPRLSEKFKKLELLAAHGRKCFFALR